MSGCGDNKNPLQRSGTSQQQRLLAGLQVNYVNVDERDFSDWIFFASELSKYINYFNVENTTAGDWTPFFSSDVSALLSIAAIQNVEEYRREIKGRFDFLKDEDSVANMNEVEENLTELFGGLLSFSQALDQYLSRLPQNITLKSTVQNLVKIKLASPLKRLLSYYKGASDLGFLQPTDFNGWKVWNQEVVDAVVVIAAGLSNNWQTNTALSWVDYVSDINLPKDDSIFGDPAWTEFRRINHAAHHNLFSSVFDQYLAVFATIVQEAEKELLKTLEQWDTHPAHYALFLSFLKLFKFAQGSVNTITQRHLDFYYKEVLRLQPKEAIPNSAHILVELAKQVQDHVLLKDTLFKGGKDSAGKEVVYGLDKEETFNKAKVALLKSVFKGNSDGRDDHENADAPGTSVNNKGRLFAASVVNSESPKEWHPFMHKVFNEGKLTDIATPNALIGFAIASNYLFLTEGERKIFIRFNTNNNSKLTNIPVECYLTTEKEWFKVPGNHIFHSGNMINGTSCAELSFIITGDVDPITNFNTETHGGTFNTNTPVLKVYLKNEDNADYKYDDLKDIIVTQAEVEVKVGLSDTDTVIDGGLKNLTLSNDTGVIDPSRPFLPFGTAPKTNASLIIGNEEVFKKKDVQFLLRFEWTDMPHYWYIDFETPDTMEADGPEFYPKVSTKYLAQGIWKNLIATATDIFNFNATTILFPGSLQPLNINYNEAILPYTEEYVPYNVTSKKGFLKLQLNGDFGHELYQETLTLYLIDQAKPAPTGIPDKPTEPYTPTMLNISLHYKASGVSSLNTTDEATFQVRPLQFFHIYPFGEVEQHQFLTGDSIYLLPQFGRYEAGASLPHVGEFYIGLENLAPQQSVNILFQVMEGSSDPRVEKPVEHVHWSYLSNNKWIAFDKQGIGDATRQLIQSGIITFIIPGDATIVNTMFPSGYIWLKASVDKAAEAVCSLLAVEAQAAVVSFRPNGNAADFLDTPLPASTITKLKTPDAAIKKVNQPFSTFGGRPKESGDHYYRRVSERLRHKARAITIWDYEHLVLEAFPQIHKVKCLNHTKIESGEYNETAPGYVSVITVPALVNRNDTNPLRPFTPENTLKEIEEFLGKKISCHVKLRVRNPQFEEVRLSFSLRLAAGFNDFTFYSKQLKQEITEFLTPWAFTSGADIQFGGKIYKSVLINFIEERPYVDFITNVEMYHRIDETSTIESGDLDEITASTARSILVSASVSKHNIIEIIPEDVEIEPECLQINTDGSK